MAIKILVAGDLHLGRSSGGIPGGLEEISTRGTWQRIVERCITGKTDMLLLTGDIVDRDNRYFEAIGPLQSGFARLRDAGIRVYMVAGNHDFDVLQQIAGSGDYDNVRLLGKGGEWELARFELGDRIIQVAGWSFPMQYVYENPLLSFNGITIDRNYPVIGLLHCDLAAGETRYGPVGETDLLATGVDVWALGHIHKPWVINREGPLVFYPGSPHALSAKETGVRGAFLLTIEGRAVSFEHIPLSPVRYESLPVDITGCSGEAGVRSRIIAGIHEDGLEISNGQPDLAWIVYDIVLTGAHKSPREVAFWASSGREDYSHEIRPGTRIIIRSLESNISVPVENLENLASETSPAGELAKTLLALEKGGSTPFMDLVLAEWNSKFQAVSESPAYLPVRQAVKNSGIGQEGVILIEKECRRLLGELLQQNRTSQP
jgi:DNA repair protein SbcD/Mre11